VSERLPAELGEDLVLLERISVGGMAEVFKAKSVGVQGFERLVAVKRILPQLAEDDEFVQMFIDEARIASTLTHQNIVQILELGQAQGTYFISMEYVPGLDLRQTLDLLKDSGRRLPPHLAGFIASKLAEALAYAHKKTDGLDRALDIVHRDVTPQNVLLSWEGEVKLCDFGIARAASKAAKTQVGVLKGKFAYMSPEMVEGEAIDQRSDLFALGNVLYEMLTNERLFLADTDYATIEAVREARVPPVRAFAPDVPPDLEQVVGRLLQRDPEDRYGTAAEVIEDLLPDLIHHGRPVHEKHLRAWLRQTFGDDPGLARADSATPVVAITDVEPDDPVAPSPRASSEPSGTDPADSRTELRHLDELTHAAPLIEQSVSHSLGPPAVWDPPSSQLGGDASASAVVVPAWDDPAEEPSVETSLSGIEAAPSGLDLLGLGAVPRQADVELDPDADDEKTEFDFVPPGAESPSPEGDGDPDGDPPDPTTGSLWAPTPDLDPKAPSHARSVQGPITCAESSHEDTAEFALDGEDPTPHLPLAGGRGITGSYDPMLELDPQGAQMGHPGRAPTQREPVRPGRAGWLWGVAAAGAGLALWFSVQSLFSDPVEPGGAAEGRGASQTPDPPPGGDSQPVPPDRPSNLQGPAGASRRARTAAPRAPEPSPSDPAAGGSAGGPLAPGRAPVEAASASDEVSTGGPSAPAAPANEPRGEATGLRSQGGSGDRPRSADPGSPGAAIAPNQAAAAAGPTTDGPTTAGPTTAGPKADPRRSELAAARSERRSRRLERRRRARMRRRRPPRRPDPPPAGSLVVATEPPGLRIWVDGDRLDAVTPVRKPLELPPGDHEVRIELPDGRTYDFPVRIESGETTELWKRLR